MLILVIAFLGEQTKSNWCWKKWLLVSYKPAMKLMMERCKAHWTLEFRGCGLGDSPLSLSQVGWVLWPSFYFCKMRGAQPFQRLPSSFGILWRPNWIYWVSQQTSHSTQHKVSFPFSDFIYQHTWQRLLKGWSFQRPWLMGVGSFKDGWCFSRF